MDAALCASIADAADEMHRGFDSKLKDEAARVCAPLASHVHLHLLCAASHPNLFSPYAALTVHVQMAVCKEWNFGGYQEWLAKLDKYAAAHVGPSGFLVADQVRAERTRSKYSYCTLSYTVFELVLTTQSMYKYIVYMLH